MIVLPELYYHNKENAIYYWVILRIRVSLVGPNRILIRKFLLHLTLILVMNHLIRILLSQYHSLNVRVKSILHHILLNGYCNHIIIYRSPFQLTRYCTPFRTLGLIFSQYNFILLLTPCHCSQIRVQLIQESLPYLFTTTSRQLIRNTSPILTKSLHQLNYFLILIKWPFLFALSKS